MNVWEHIKYAIAALLDMSLNNMRIRDDTIFKRKIWIDSYMLKIMCHMKKKINLKVVVRLESQN